jgi:hypothetical protein
LWRPEPESGSAGRASTSVYDTFRCVDLLVFFLFFNATATTFRTFIVLFVTSRVING